MDIIKTHENSFLVGQVEAHLQDEDIQFVQTRTKLAEENGWSPDRFWVGLVACARSLGYGGRLCWFLNR